MLNRIVIIFFTFIGVSNVVFRFIQLVPYGQVHTNPPVISEPHWDSHQTRDLAKRACFDCHSNETIWRLYSNVALISWLVYKDVAEVRQQFNFSEWQISYLKDAEEFIEIINKGDDTPFHNLLMHPDARLTIAQKTQLIISLSASVNY